MRRIRLAAVVPRPRSVLIRALRVPLAALLALVFVVGLTGPVARSANAAPSQTSAPGSVADLERRLRDAQAASDAAVARFQEATARNEALIDQIAAVEEQVAQGRARATELRKVVQARAVEAYKSGDVGRDATAAVLGAGNVMTEIRRTTLLQHANARDDRAIAQLRALDEDLGIQKAQLQDARAEASRVVERLESEKAALASTLADAQRAYDDLVARLAREAASRAAAERAAQLVAAAARRPAAAVGTPVGGFLCPVRGSFSNDYGDARSGGRSHAGNDIFAATGTPVVAVKSGSLSHESGGGGGNAAYVSAGDGNTYYFAHFSAYAGGPRQVAQGEVIGYVGMTGNASAPHLHFEIRTSSGPVNPYPTLVASC